MKLLNAIKRSTNVALGTLCLSLIGAPTLSAQHNHNHPGRTCHAMENLEHRETTNPKLKSKMSAIERHTQRVLQSGELAQARNGVITIPVVVHVMYNNSNENISDAQIQSQLDVLNEDFRRTNSDANNKWSQAADVEIEFVLANRDPNGNATTGITRKQVSRTSWGTNDDMKKTSQGGVAAWDSRYYLNMWICNIGGGILGYAQFPGGAASTDGVVMSPQYFGSSDKGNGFYLSAPFDKGRTTTHEVGHWLNLRHIWGDGACGQDDFVNDTPESDAANYGCSTNHSSCGSTDMVENYMDYSDDACMNLFTQGQKTRMQALFTAGGARASLLNSNGYVDGSTGGGGSTPTFCSAGSEISTFPYGESFENGLGDWSQANNDDIDWTNNSGTTASSGTGAAGAADGSYYMYVESSNPNYPNKAAVLNSPCFDLSAASTADVSFQYHMYGSNMGTLELQASTDGNSWVTVWSRSGDQGNAWAAAAADLSAYVGGNVQLRFRGTTGNGYRGDITIDAFALTTNSGGNTGGGNNGGGSSDCVGGDVSLSLTTDDYGSETSWTLKDANGTTIESSASYGNNQTVNLDWNLAEGNYTFEIVDQYGDGMCCTYGNGSYSLTSGGTVIVSGGDYGSSETTTFCVENTTTGGGGGGTAGCPTIDFNTYAVQSYGGTQDNGSFSNGDASTVTLTGNSWKAIDYTYTVTPNTVIEFEFGSTTQGEIHGIGFDNDNSISSDKTVRLYGTQNWGLANYASDYTSSAGSWKAYVIPIGQLYTGTFSKLFFANDDDANSAANSHFRNIKIYEGSCGAKSANIDYSQSTTVIFQNQGENDFAVKVYPNPAHDLINIELDTYDEGVEGTIIDATGRQIWSAHLDRGVNNINIKNLAPGMYNFTAVQPNGQYITKKFVKK